MRLFSAFTLGAALLLGAASASAFCRSTTCTGGDCPRDDDGCKTTGTPIAWPGVCVGFSLQRDGTTHIPLSDVRLAVEKSFATWSEIPCKIGTASILFAELDDVSCHRTEYDGSKPNANVILFQDTKWTYNGPNDTLAKTTVTFDADTGEIFDADIEVNHAYNEFTTGDDHVVYDLESVLTHEIGHFLGIDHSPDPDATMYAGYDEGSIEQRSLEADDTEALCQIYPSSRSGKCEPEPKNGLSDECGQAPAKADPKEEGGGCALTTPSTDATPVALLVSALALSAARRRRRR